MDQGYSNDTGVATVLAAMAVMNTEAIAKAIDPEGRAKVMQQGADETKLALSKANEALRMGDVTRELSKDVAPLLTEMKALTGRTIAIDACAPNLLARDRAIGSPLSLPPSAHHSPSRRAQPCRSTSSS